MGSILATVVLQDESDLEPVVAKREEILYSNTELLKQIWTMDRKEVMTIFEFFGTDGPAFLYAAISRLYLTKLGAETRQKIELAGLKFHVEKIEFLEERRQSRRRF